MGSVQKRPVLYIISPQPTGRAINKGMSAHGVLHS